MGAVGCPLDLDYLDNGHPVAVAADSGGDDVIFPDAFEPDSSALPDAAGGGDDDGPSGDGPLGNLMINPGFEDGTTGWYTWQGTVVASTAFAHSGAYSGCLVGQPQDGRGPAQNVTAVVLSSSTYAFDAWVRWGPAVDSDDGDAGSNDGGGDPASPGDAGSTGGGASPGDAGSTGDAASGDAGSTGDAPTGDAASTGDSGAGDAASTGDSGTGDAASTGDSGAGDASAGTAATLYEDVRVLMVAVCPDGSAHFGACVSGLLVPEGAWTELAGVCDGAIVGLCGEAGSPQVELYFDTVDPGIGLCVDDVSLTAN